MKFHLLDKITGFDSKTHIRAVKGLTLAEEYLADHFPGNPVMPGVLMLEAMVQSGAWLLKATQNFAYSICAVREVSNVRYAKFLMPGDQLLLDVNLLGVTGQEASFSGQGRIGEKAVVSARWVARFFNLAEGDARMSRNDKIIVEDAKERFRIMGGEALWKQTVASAS